MSRMFVACWAVRPGSSTWRHRAPTGIHVDVRPRPGRSIMAWAKAVVFHPPADLETEEPSGCLASRHGPQSGPAWAGTA